VASVANGTGDHPGAEAAGLLAQAGETVRGLVLVVEFGEVPAVLTGYGGAEAGALVDALRKSG